MSGYGNTTANCIDILKSLIAIPSPSGSENRVGEFIQKRFYGKNVKIVRIPISDGRFALIVDIGGKRGGKTLMLAGHMDTVPPVEGWQTDPFTPVEEGDKIRGLGSCDMKAGLAVMLAIGELACAQSERLKETLCLAFVPDEEAFSVGVRALIQHGVSADFCLMPEPHFDHAVIGGPGKMLLRLSAVGKSAHGAKPWEGINAVTELSRFIAELARLQFPSSAEIPAQPFVPLSIKGGPDTYSLSVPERCDAILSKQLVVGETKESVLSKLQALSETIETHAKICWEVIPPFYPAYSIEKNTTFVEQFRAIYSKRTGTELPLLYGTSVSDANCLTAEASIPTLVFGPAGGNMHQPNEWVSIESIAQCLDIYKEYIFMETAKKEGS